AERTGHRAPHLFSRCRRCGGRRGVASWRTMNFLVDTDILSLFAKAEPIGLLLRLFRVERIPITQSVFNELAVPLEYGYQFPHTVFAVSVTISLSETELAIYETLRLEGIVSAADAEQIAVCQARGWAYVTMD